MFCGLVVREEKHVFRASFVSVLRMVYLSEVDKHSYSLAPEMTTSCAKFAPGYLRACRTRLKDSNFSPLSVLTSLSRHGMSMRIPYRSRFVHIGMKSCINFNFVA
jgi:hypothetical protein